MPMRWDTHGRVVIVVRDQSGSMDYYNPSIHQGCRDMEETMGGLGIPVHFVAFAGYAEESSFIDNLKHVTGATKIAPAFKLVKDLLAARGTPKQLDVVFISDGEDMDMPGCKLDLEAMEPLTCRCRLFCVGVTAGFPTNLVTDHLYARFGWGSDRSTPPVIPLETPSETQSVFKQLEGYLAEPKARPTPSAEDITESMPASELSWAAKAVYNACMHRCLFTKNSSAELPVLVDHARIMSVICAMAARLVKEDKDRKRGSQGHRPRLMPSELLAAEEEDRKAAENSPGKALKLANELRAKLRELINKAERGALMASLDNDAKRNVAGFAGRYGVHAMKALKYHGADAALTRAGFLETVRNYQGCPGDAALEDEISACTLEEFMLDAKGVLPQLDASVGSVIDILSKVPLIGRTLTIQPPCDGAEMNPWLVEVVGMPTFVKVMTTYDLLHTPPEVLNMRANKTARAAAAPVASEWVNGSRMVRTASGWERQMLIQPTAEELLEFPVPDGMPRGLVTTVARGTGEPPIDYDPWGGVEEFTIGYQPTITGDMDEFASGYLTEYEDHGDDEDRDARPAPRKPARRDPPPETINHLLLLPGSLGGGARPGWMHQAATYLLLRNETLFFFDAWMGTMAATVTYLLGQPDVSVGWVQAELARVQGAFSAVYRNDNCDHFWRYCSAILDNGTHRSTLLTQSGDSNAALRCPHLTKPVFAMWILLHVTGATFTQQELRERHMAFLVEFFHRAKVVLQWECPARCSTQDWLKEHSLGGIKDPLSYGATLAAARKAYLREIQAGLRDLARPEDIIPGEPQIDMRGVNSARHYQFTVASIGQVFVNLARLAGVPGYSPDVPPRSLARLLLVGSIADNAKRGGTPSFAAPMPEVEFRKASTRKAMGLFKSAAIVLADATFCYEYKEALNLAHRELPRTVPAGHAERFRAKWGVDVAAKLGLRKCGLSSAVCMSPACPYFMTPLGGVPAYAKPEVSLATPGDTRIGCQLWLHLEPLRIFPGLHKAAQRIIDEGRAEELQGRDDAAVEVLKGADLVWAPTAEAKIQRRMESDLAEIRGRVWRRGMTPERLAELEEILTNNYGESMNYAKRDYGERLRARMDEALYTRGFSGDTQMGKSYVANRIHKIAADRDAWDYAEFEAAVLASPLFRDAHAGRFAAVARP